MVTSALALAALALALALAAAVAVVGAVAVAVAVAFRLTHRFDETIPFLYGLGQPVMSPERWPSSVGIEPESLF